jgi:YD repeat-containing protein
MSVERMTKIIIAALALASLATNAAAEQQQRTFYNLSGKVIGRSSTDSQGTVTNYDVTGKVISRATTSGNTKTIYDAGGRVIGRETTNR